MKFLREIGQVITRAGVKKHIFFSAEDLIRPTDQGARFLEFIVRKPIDSDREALEGFYKGPRSGYYMMKARAKNRMLETLSHLNIRSPEYSPETVALYKVSKLHFWVRTLLALGARTSAIHMAEEGLEVAQEFQFTQQELDFLHMLKHHASLSGDWKLFLHYSAESKAKQQVLLAEFELTELIEHIQCRFGRANIQSEEDEEFVRGALATANKDLSAVSHTLAINRFRLRVLCHQLLKEFQSSYDAALEARDYLSRNSFYYSTFRFAEFAMYRLKSALHLRDHSAGQEAVTECDRLLPFGSNNWFIYMEDYFLLAMQTRNIDHAATKLNQVLMHPRFDRLPFVRKEKWKIFESYVAQARRMLGDFSAKDPRKVSLYPEPDLSVEAPTYKRDKHGYNISIIILQILKLIESRQMGKIVGKMEALSSYRARYLVRTTKHQSALFFKLLRIMVSSDFDYIEARRKGKKYYDLLLTTPIDQVEMEEGMQILPYDWLWGWVLDQLKAHNEEQAELQKQEEARLLGTGVV